MEAGSEHALANATRQCYRHLFYPSRNRIATSAADLSRSAIDLHAASAFRTLLPPRVAVSVTPSAWEFSPVEVIWRGAAEGLADRTTSLDNWWDAAQSGTVSADSDSSD